MLPTRQEAERILQEAEGCNPGPWGDHSRTAAHCPPGAFHKSGFVQYGNNLLQIFLRYSLSLCNLLHFDMVVDGVTIGDLVERRKKRDAVADYSI